jgi:hypothetical protein
MTGGGSGIGRLMALKLAKGDIHLKSAILYKKFATKYLLSATLFSFLFSSIKTHSYISQSSEPIPKLVKTENILESHLLLF